MDAILEYLTLKITAREFLNRVMHEDAVYDRIQSKIPKAVLPMMRNGKDLPFAQKRSNMTILTCDGRFPADIIHWCVHSVARQRIK